MGRSCEYADAIQRPLLVSPNPFAQQIVSQLKVRNWRLSKAKTMLAAEKR
jgi:hypothetical protein